MFQSTVPHLVEMTQPFYFHRVSDKLCDLCRAVLSLSESLISCSKRDFFKARLVAQKGWEDWKNRLLRAKPPQTVMKTVLWKPQEAPCCGVHQLHRRSYTFQELDLPASRTGSFYCRPHRQHPRPGTPAHSHGLTSQLKSGASDQCA